MFNILPESKVYIPGPKQCIYCFPRRTTEDLRREHIIPHKLGGKLILHQACCVSCQDLINREIEIPTLKRCWYAARHKLGLPTSEAVEELRIGEWDSKGGDLPQSIEEDNFQFRKINIADYPMTVLQMRLAPPGILWNRELETSFHLQGMDLYTEGAPNVLVEKGRKAGFFEPFSPNIICRSIAKIAHGAAVAELGLDTFEPFLPDIILGHDPYISHYVGSKIGKGHKRIALHEISLTLQGGFIVAQVQLFARLGLRPYIAVVGRSKDSRMMGLSSIITLSSAALKA